MSLLETVLLLVLNSHWNSIGKHLFCIFIPYHILHFIPFVPFSIPSTLWSVTLEQCITVHLHLLGGSFKCRALMQVRCISMDTSFEHNVTYVHSQSYSHVTVPAVTIKTNSYPFNRDSPPGCASNRKNVEGRSLHHWSWRTYIRKK